MDRPFTAGDWIRYQDSDKMAAVVEDVCKMLGEHQDIDLGRILIVSFVSFDPSSLVFYLRVYQNNLVAALL